MDLQTPPLSSPPTPKETENQHGVAQLDSWQILHNKRELQRKLQDVVDYLCIDGIASRMFDYTPPDSPATSRRRFRAPSETPSATPPTSPSDDGTATPDFATFDRVVGVKRKHATYDEEECTIKRQRIATRSCAAKITIFWELDTSGHAVRYKRQPRSRKASPTCFPKR